MEAECPLREKHRILGHMGCSHDYQMCTNNWHDKCRTRPRIQSYHEAKCRECPPRNKPQQGTPPKEGRHDQP